MQNVYEIKMEKRTMELIVRLNLEQVLKKYVEIYGERSAIELITKVLEQLDQSEAA